jgi:hypothetical protein
LPVTWKSMLDPSIG